MKVKVRMRCNAVLFLEVTQRVSVKQVLYIYRDATNSKPEASCHRRSL